MKMKIKKVIKFFYYKLYEILNYFYIVYIKNKNKLKNEISISSNLDGETILILAPHIDDDIIGCGGAILRYLSENKDVYIVYLTNSGKQGSQPEKSKVVEERKLEAINVAYALNLKKEKLFFLNGEDGDLINSKIDNELKNIINSVNPDTIFMPCFLDSHNDHFAVTKTLWNINNKNCNLFTNVNLYLYESQSPFTPLYSNVFLDITDIYKTKKMLLKFYISQTSDFKFSYYISKINGYTFNNKTLCEAYIKTTFSNYFNLYTEHCGSFENYLKIKNQIIPYGYSDTLIKSYNSSFKFKSILKKL
ncbi:PIG-L deacetylase family protein [Clostridium sp. CF012]|uniref:PIG-L deacetylase family protein n=1 Tax=Clostridium sp. CF012 TaxID=2843319 RepID=UPI001C0B30E9|nr:PIG-L family deacetylase [Clostridium sp. CF012]MBU3144787.1 PIG-L family deacetylase [Clostridium sp. CF012]